jgi:hypothetical protein
MRAGLSSFLAIASWICSTNRMKTWAPPARYAMIGPEGRFHAVAAHMA